MSRYSIFIDRGIFFRPQNDNLTWFKYPIKCETSHYLIEGYVSACVSDLIVIIESPFKVKYTSGHIPFQFLIPELRWVYGRNTQQFDSSQLMGRGLNKTTDFITRLIWLIDHCFLDPTKLLNTIDQYDSLSTIDGFKLTQTNIFQEENVKVEISSFKKFIEHHISNLN